MSSFFFETVWSPAVEEKTENVGESKIQKIPFEISDSSFTICRYCGSKIGSNNAFCTNCGVTVTQYIESSFEYLAKEVAAGNIVISKGGITKISN